MILPIDSQRRTDTGGANLVSAGEAAQSAPMLSREASPENGASQQLSQAQPAREESVSGKRERPDGPTAKQSPKRRKTVVATQSSAPKDGKQKAPPRATLRVRAARKGTPEPASQKAGQHVGRTRRSTSAEKSPRQRPPPEHRSPAAKAKHHRLSQPLDCQKTAAQKRRRANTTVKAVKEVSKEETCGATRNGGSTAAVMPAAELQTSSEDEFFTDIPLLLHPHSTYLANHMLGGEAFCLCCFFSSCPFQDSVECPRRYHNFSFCALDDLRCLKSMKRFR